MHLSSKNYTTSEAKCVVFYTQQTNIVTHFQYRQQVGNLTTEEQTALMQTVSSLRDAQLRLTTERIREERQRQRENFENALSQLQTTIDEQERNLHEHRAREIEEFRRVNEEILRARQALSQEGNWLS